MASFWLQNKSIIDNRLGVKALPSFYLNKRRVIIPETLADNLIS